MNNNEQIINKLYIYYRINNPKTNNYYSKRNTHRFPVTELSHTVPYRYSLLIRLYNHNDFVYIIKNYMI